VRKENRKMAKQFTHWPNQAQADFLAPLGYEAVYETNAVTKHGEHGNAMLSRWPVLSANQEDISDHRFEQRGLLHSELLIHEQNVHMIVVHLGLINSSRHRQIAALGRYINREVPSNAPLIIAGDFNDWNEQLHGLMRIHDLHTLDSHRLPTFPARFPVLHMDRVYVRGLNLINAFVPHGRAWAQMSDHLPLIVDVQLK
jgi:endonuclease/exonuclease/phosphatase family metal-dependent hydrolase